MEPDRKQILGRSLLLGGSLAILSASYALLISNQYDSPTYAVVMAVLLGLGGFGGAYYTLSRRPSG